MQLAIRTTLVAALLAAASVAGCGLGPGRGSSGATLTVTREFGSARIGEVTRARVPGAETVMRMLARAFAVQTRYGGGFVESIDGHAGGGDRRDWFYYVNGIEARTGAASTAVHRGDRVWWDLHDWRATLSIPAVVGSFPEPFLHGAGGKRLPTTVQCAPELLVACNAALAALRKIGAPAAPQLLGTGSGSESLGLVVGTWRELRGGLGASLLAAGPARGGVYARFGGSGETLALLDPAGAVVRTLGAGAGLLAATADRSSVPIWFVTGTDARGVLAAARALTPARLRNHFALAIAGGQDLPLPLEPSR